MADFDDNMREMGVGDVIVHRKVKKATAGLFERSLDYRAALASPGDTALSGKLAEHVPVLSEQPDLALRLAARIRSRSNALDAAADGQLLAGAVSFVPIG